MQKDKINRKELTTKLVSDFLIQREYLDSEMRKNLIDYSLEIYNKDLKELYDINRRIVENKESYEGNSISYVNQKGKYLFIVDGSIIELQLAEIKEIVRGLIDILEDTLPLGSVVKLKDEYIKKAFNNTDIKDAEFVIVNRFVFENDAKIFMPYSGIVYPVGFGGDAKAFHFTSSLIDKVIHRGYFDDKEEAYIYLVKNELIVEKNMHSFGFATDDEMQKFNEMRKRREIND